MECNCSKSGDCFGSFLLAMTSEKTFYEVIKLKVVTIKAGDFAGFIFFY